MDLNSFLNDKLNANLHVIKHRSFNQVFLGYSKLYDKNIFVKVFPESHHQKLLAERSVNEQLNDRVITTIQVGGGSVLVLEDLNPTDLEVLNEKTAFQMGKVLSQFHTKVKPFAQIKRYSVKFEPSSYPKDLRNIFDSSVEDELNSFPRIVVHGDVGLRNYKIVNGEMLLIDYERAQLVFAYQDFIKLFYQDFQLNSNLISSFIKGYNPSLMVSERAQLFLILLCAMGIMQYTKKIDDKNFRMVGFQMLQSIRNSIR